MNYSGNMPDWHQYNASQRSRTSSSSLISGGIKNGNKHIYVPGASSPALDGIALTNEIHRMNGKNSNDGSIYHSGRNYGIASGAIQLGGTHYSSTSVQDPIMDTLSPIGISVAPASVTDDVSVAHHNAQIAFVSGTSGNIPGSVVNPGSVMHNSIMGSQCSPMGSSSPVRGAVIGGSQTYSACKAPCCNSDSNLYQHWEKYPHYGNNASTYRETIRQANSYSSSIDGRRYLPDVRKDCHETKEIIEAGSYSGDHRGTRHYQDYSKYGRKDSLMTRAYPVGSGNTLLHQNYPMQSYQFPSDYQKCPYSVKDYARRSSTNHPPVANAKNSGMMKYNEQNVMVTQTYQHPKQLQYQSAPGSASSTARPNVNNVSPGLQTSFYNSNHHPRNYLQDYGSQDQSVVANRMAQSATSAHVHGSFQKYHVYHQKIAMQRFSLENHLRAFSRIPGYQTHPKYQECVMRYRELLRLQQTVDYQNIIQESPKVPSPSTAQTSPGVAPISLQFDQNGMLINSNYMSSSGVYNSGAAGSVSTNDINNSVANKNRSLPFANESYENSHDSSDRKNERASDDNEKLMNHNSNIDPLRGENAESYFVVNEKKSEEDHELTAHETSKLNINKNCQRMVFMNERDKSKSPGSPIEEYKSTNDFADKPELDVRQFLANWDESEDEETATSVLEVTRKSKTPENFEKNSSINSEVTAEKEASTQVNVEKKQENVSEIECVESVESMDDIPTIHIVENVESNGVEMEKIHTVFGDLASTVLKPVSICESAAEIQPIEARDLTETDTAIVLFEQTHKICSKVLEFKMGETVRKKEQQLEQQLQGKIDNVELAKGAIVSCADVPRSVVDDSISIEDKGRPDMIQKNSCIDALADIAKETSTTMITTTKSIASISSPSNSLSSSCETSSSNPKRDGDVTVPNLHKQNSFTSDESHNPDDISLPDLQTSECTPISTTLNTPIHSDSEELSEHVTDLTTSTNPIEIIQNSPIISFTHSPIKIEPYEQLERARISDNSQTITNEPASLDFDFDEEVASNENRKYNENCDSSPESVVEELENQAKDVMYKKKRSVQTMRDSSNEKKNDYYHDPLVGMAPLTSPQTEKTSSLLRDANVTDQNPNNNVGAENSAEMLEHDNVAVDEFNRSGDLETLCDMSLDGTCLIPLIPDDVVCDEPRIPVSPMEGNCLTKILNNTLPITDLDVLDNSGSAIIDKTNGEDDVWGQVSQIGEHFQTSSVEPVAEKMINVKSSTNMIQTNKSYEKNRSQIENDDCCYASDNNNGFPQNTEGKKSLEKDENSMTTLDKVLILGQNERKKTSKLHHVDSNVEIQVANFNVRIHNEVEKIMDDETKNQESSGKAIEIKINLSRGDVTRIINKNLEDQLQEGEIENKKKRNHLAASVGKICGRRRRRRSLPEPTDNFESKRARKITDEELSKKLNKHKRNRRFRKSMDDKLLLMNEEYSCRENSTSSSSETNFRRKTAIMNKKARVCTLPVILPDARSLNIQKDDLMEKLKNNTYTRTEKQKDTCCLPSPSYNSSVLDVDNFDVAPNHYSNIDERSSFVKESRFTREKQRYEDADRKKKLSNRFEELTTTEAFEKNLNTVPIYTTKDGRITYSPNRNYTYQALIMEAQQRGKRSSSGLKKLFHYSKLRNPYRDIGSRQSFAKLYPILENKKSVDHRKSRTKRTIGKFHDDMLGNTDIKLRKHENCRTKEISKEDQFDITEISEKTIIEQQTSEVNVRDLRSVPEDWEHSKTTEILHYVSMKNPELVENSIGPKNACVNDFEAGVVARIFDDQELEISTRDIDRRTDRSAVLIERESCDSSLRFFPENFELPKTKATAIMASPSTKVIEKKPQMWSIDFQAALSDSGLESSTTFADAFKDSRKIQKWTKSFCDRASKPMFIVSQGRKIDSGSTYLSNENNKSFNQIPKELSANIREQFLETILMPVNYDTTEIVDSLDLAFPFSNQEDYGQITRKKRRRKTKKELNEARAKTVNESSDLFRRCVSNDSGEFTGLLFQIPKSRDNWFNVRDAISNETILEESEVPTGLDNSSILETENFTPPSNDTCSILSSSKILEESSELTMVTTVLQLEDTSTRFASESMDFNDLHPLTNDDNLMYEKSNSYLDENAVDPSIDCSRKSDDSGKAPILSFSGQIQSDGSLGDSYSKSPPSLAHESHWSGISEVSIKKLSNKVHPKIPKMIIKNIKSRPGTPTSAEDGEKILSTNAKISSRSYNQGIKIDESGSKIPKIKIRLEDSDLPRMISRDTKYLRDGEKKIKNKKNSKLSVSAIVKKQLPLVGKLSRQSSEVESQDSKENTDNSSYKFTLMQKSSKHHHHRSRSKDKLFSKSHQSRSIEKLPKRMRQEKIPKLTIKKHSSISMIETSVAQASEETMMQKCELMIPKKDVVKKEEMNENNKKFDDCYNKNDDSQQSIAEKVPKVIIKRASPSAEFKCELSKNDRDAIIKDSKWQPEVKLQRFWVLDCMAKEPGNGQVALKVLESTLDQVGKNIWNDLVRKSNCIDSGSQKSNEKKVHETKVRRKSDCDLSKSQMVISKNRRKSFDLENIDLTTRTHNFTAKNSRKEIPANGGSKKLQASNFGDNSHVIKIDSSDESQTTIEILPASPGNIQSELEQKNQFFMANGSMGKLYSEDAIPTQFELELEIVDNSSVDSLDVPIPSCSLKGNDYEEGESKYFDKIIKSSENNPEKKSLYKTGASSLVASMKNICCSDSLVKEVLAAKETLKRYLEKKISKDFSSKTSRPRPKTAAEKKQGSGYEYFLSDNHSIDKKDIAEIPVENKIKVSKGEKLVSLRETDRITTLSEIGKESTKSIDWKRPRSTSHIEVCKPSKMNNDNFMENVHVKSIAAVQPNTSTFAEKAIAKNKKKASTAGLHREIGKTMKSYKIPKISQIRENLANSITCCFNEETRKSPSPIKMPILEPQMDLNFELSGRDSDRDYSRSPPVITKHERSPDNISASKQMEDLNVDSKKIDNVEKERDTSETSVTFADIVSQLAYHEKATIRHRRYCKLCERWFPTAARHRRHLTGYQHRHTELTQRRTVHALFMLFTGKPCPRLLPASIVRTDCAPGEPTPLQIAVQDVAISLEDGACTKLKKPMSDQLG
ncbi:uncharacterized protein [Venturia canescens]|uniref:uncharacterized protein n=1 Tax=Venturia canescens TaxID=32260 RepID=UPI001C9C0AB6|nr:uncharacterized protein LOC122417823 [Venturia canescens]XP_043287569.1 uncharacterized protein LOC122417823 [Venturia canescens]